jgi:predicted RNase H-like HicB family nuclease
MPKPNYRVVLSFDGERQTWLARAPELEHCSAEGPSRAEAIAKVEEEIEAQIQNMHAHGASPPPAVDEESFSGELTVKISRSLHRDLVWAARSEGVEVDHLAGQLLAAVLAERPARGGGGRRSHGQGESVPHDSIGNERGPGGGGGGRPRQYGQRGGYQQGLMDDRAHFIEYVRNLDNGQPQHGARPGGGGPMHAHGPGGGGGGGRRRRGRGRGPGGGYGGGPGGPGGPGGNGPGPGNGGPPAGGGKP